LLGVQRKPVFPIELVPQRGELDYWKSLFQSIMTSHVQYRQEIGHKPSKTKLHRCFSSPSPPFKRLA